MVVLQKFLSPSEWSALKNRSSVKRAKNAPFFLKNASAPAILHFILMSLKFFATLPEDSPAGWPQRWRNTGEQFRTDGRPTSQWSRLAAGRSDDLGTQTTAPNGSPNQP
jgi:hypothetical protein